MQGRARHTHSLSETMNHRAQLSRAYQELGRELSSTKIRMLGNYTLGKVIGEGTYGKVRIGTHRMTSTRVAIKQIPKEMSAQLTREIHHHRRLHHPHVTQLYEVLATEGSIWLVTELCSGGELFDYLVEKGRLSEEETRKIFGQLCLAMHYVHESGTVHRDLKLENVLLDDRCNVKLGDFGFTREFEHGRLLDTFCGTTGYAAPEMLLGQKYSGPEVDIWSLGIILHCLLTGTLPFDDDDETVMKDKIIAGVYEESDWLSANARNLIKGILRTSPSERLTIPQMLNHPWFTDDDPLLSPPPLDLDSSAQDVTSTSDAQSQPPPVVVPAPIDLAAVTNALREQIPDDSREASESSSTTSEAHHSGASDDHTDLTSVTTPDAQSSPEVPLLPLEQTASLLGVGVSRSASQSTLGPTQNSLRTQRASKLSVASKKSDSTAFAPVAEVAEEDEGKAGSSLSRSGSLKGKPPPPPSAFPTRTPARTKRRSVSSNNISAPTSPTEPSFPVGVGARPIGPQDYHSLLSTSAPLLFSTPLERSLLSSLSALGFDTGQIVHSVLTNACDSTGAIWWLLKKKAERREAAEARRIAEERRKTLEALDDPLRKSVLGMSNIGVGDASLESMLDRPSSMEASMSTEGRYSPFQIPPPPSIQFPPRQHSGSPTLVLPTKPDRKGKAKAIDPLPMPEVPPDISIAFTPPTPSPQTLSTPRTPPHQLSAAGSTATLGADLDSARSTLSSAPSTPGTPGKDKRSGKQRSGSVSMLQRAAGLVRKKSEEKMKEILRSKEIEKDVEGSEATHSNASSKLSWGRTSESVHSHTNSPTPPPSTSSASNKLTKPPPVSKGKEREGTPEPNSVSATSPESSWQPVTGNVLRTPSHSTPQPALARFKLTSPSFLSTHVEDKPTESFNTVYDENSESKGRSTRGSIFDTFRLWFQEDRKKGKGKGKAKSKPASPMTAYGPGTPSTPARSQSTIRKGTKKRQVTGPHGKRPSVSSRRSSSVNSRRSSVTSIPPQRRPSDFMLPQPLSPDSMHLISRQRSDASRRSHTPSSEVGSRPSSIRSFNRTPRAHPARPRSPSQSSTGSSRARHTASPMFHRRLGSGSSSRVVRQVHLVHNRNNSQASSTRSSRHNSLDIPGMGGVGMTASDLGEILERSITPSRERKPATTTVFVAKQGNVFGAPSARVPLGRASWKKSWGAEPPSWASVTQHAPVETFSDPGHGEGNLRDVFSGRQSLDPFEDDEWVDEDEESPFVGGLGQFGHLLAPGISNNAGNPPSSPSLRTKIELPPPLMGSKSRNGGTRLRPVSAPLALKALPELPPRAGGLRTSPTPPVLALGSETSPPSAASGEAPPATSSGPHITPASRGWRPMQGVRTAAEPSFKQHPIQEEDEDEE